MTENSEHSGLLDKIVPWDVRNRDEIESQICLVESWGTAKRYWCPRAYLVVDVLLVRFLAGLRC